MRVASLCGTLGVGAECKKYTEFGRCCRLHFTAVVSCGRMRGPSQHGGSIHLDGDSQDLCGTWE